jgi:D-sedoheptulose 7-phosphate isomerase
MTDPQQLILASIRRSAAVIGSLSAQSDGLSAICRAVVDCLDRGGKVLTMGHGGSAADALHMAEELMGRFDADRRPLPAVSLVADPTLLTCIGNDYGFTAIFPRQVEALGRQGDVLVIFSTSGNGEGLCRAAEIARRQGVVVIALLGKGGGQLKGRCDHELVVDSRETARIQEAHALILHIILEAVDRHFVGDAE